jgi:flavin-dependent dehydrogenase
MFDVVVVGARCAGSPLAMLLSRQGYRVLLLDKATFPSDRISTHLIRPPGVAALHRWGLWDRIAAGRPAICYTAATSFPGGILRGPWHAVDGIAYTVNMRRFKLDAILVDAAHAAGAELREGVVVDQLLYDGEQVVGVAGRELRSGLRFEERARMVVGADGRQSFVAKAVRAPIYNGHPSLTASYYTYVTAIDKDPDVDEIYTRPPREYLFIPTDDGLTLVNVVIARPLIEAFRQDVTASFYAAFDLEPALGERLRAAERVGPIVGAVELPNFYRKPYGPGWALVGDAGYHRDPIRAQGIHEAFLDAEVLAHALDDGLAGRRSLAGALRSYEQARDERTAFPYQICLSAARFDPPQQDTFQNLVERMQDKPAAIAEFMGLVAGSMRPEVFFDPAHLQALLGPARNGDSGR